MPVLFQKVVAADSKYTFTNDPSCTMWDVHNDNPFNMGVSFGRDTGIMNADYYASPHSILYGVVAPGSDKRTIGGVKFNGTIYLYTQTPIGGGTTNLSSAPALSITVIGYPAGSNPSASTSLNRWQNVGNPVSTVGGVATSIVSDNVAPATQIVEATPSGDSASAVVLLNTGVLNLGNTVHPGRFSTDNGKVSTDGSGTLSVAGTASVTGGPTGLTVTNDTQLNGKLTSVGDTSLAQTIKFVNTGPVHIEQLNGADFIFESPAGTEMGRLTNAGVLSFIGHMLGDNGKITTDGNGNINAIGSTTPVAGTVAGTMTVSFPFWGLGIKVMLITFGGYNSTVKTVTLPTSMSRGLIIVGDLGGGTPNVQAMLSGGNVSTTAMTSFGSSANGTLVGSVAHMFQAAIHNIVSTIDAFQITPGGVCNGTIFLVGR